MKSQGSLSVKQSQSDEMRKRLTGHWRTEKRPGAKDEISLLKTEKAKGKFSFRASRRECRPVETVILVHWDSLQISDLRNCKIINMGRFKSVVICYSSFRKLICYWSHYPLCWGRFLQSSNPEKVHFLHEVSVPHLKWPLPFK